MHPSSLCRNNNSAMQLIEKGLTSGEGFSGGSEYTGLAGIAHAYLHLHNSLARTPASRAESLPEALQMLTASRDTVLSNAAQIAQAATASQQVLVPCSRRPLYSSCL